MPSTRHFAAVAIATSASAFPNVTLSSGNFNVTIFVPPTTDSSEAVYYNSTRFDWGTMVGDVRIGDHVLFPNDFWSQPHDPLRSDAGVGIASEFGCGEPGATCGAGWGAYDAGATNGVLGYEEAAVGEPFLKIGVGKLVKHDTGDYTPFVDWSHYEVPEWTAKRTGRTGRDFRLTSSVTLNEKWGYKIRRTFKVHDNTLSYTTELTNTGSEDFRTPHYSHSLALIADHQAVGPGTEVSMDTDLRDYKDTWNWGPVPLKTHLEIASASQLRVTSNVGADKIKAVFKRPAVDESKGSYRADFNNKVSVTNKIEGPLPLYCYNLYVESTTLSPEPMQMLNVPSGDTVSWTHDLMFQDRSAAIVI